MFRRSIFAMSFLVFAGCATERQHILLHGGDPSQPTSPEAPASPLHLFEKSTDVPPSENETNDLHKHHQMKKEENSKDVDHGRHQ